MPTFYDGPHRPVVLREYATRPRCAACRHRLTAGLIGGWCRHPRCVWCIDCALEGNCRSAVIGGAVLVRPSDTNPGVERDIAEIGGLRRLRCLGQRCDGAWKFVRQPLHRAKFQKAADPGLAGAALH